MTDHLTDDQLNEILDGRAESHHLDDCADCRARLEDIRSVFITLKSLPEARLTRDLTASILARLPKRGLSPAWRWAFVAQLVGALIIAATLSSSFEVPTEILTYQPPTFDSLIATVIALLSSVTFELPAFDFQTTIIDLQSTTITMLVISAAALWVIGNGLLLRGTASGSRK